MKKNILFVLLSLGMLLGSFRLEAQTPEAALKAMEEQLQRIANSDLPAFAPALYKSVQEKVRKLRRVFEKEGRLPDKTLRDAQQELEKFKTNANRTNRILSKAYQLRNAALQFNFVRAFNPALLYRAEQNYYEALKLAGEQKFDKVRMRADLAREQYQSLIRDAKAQSKRRLTGTLKGLQRAVAADLDALNANPNDPGELAGLEGVSARVNIERPGFDLDGDGIIEPPYWPPPPTPPGPLPPVAVGIEDRAANSIRLSWFDRSDNETGNRLLRSTDLLNWQAVNDTGPIPKLETFTYTDAKLQPDTRYCYMIESYNAEGARQSQMRCTFTLDGNNIPVWRLQLRVKVANIANADTENPLRIRMGDNGEHLAVENFLDYGHDDFERNSDFTYDLNIGHIRELSDITDLSIINYGEQDVIFIEEINLLVNEHEAFSRHFGITSTSALRLGLGGYRVEHADLRSNPSWQAFVSSSLTSLTFNLPPISSAGNGQFQIIIPPEQIVSRIESFVGHMLHTGSLSGSFEWGYLYGPAVEIKQINSSTIHVDLDMEATINNWPNPELDIDFDIEVAKRCNNAERKLIIELTSKNFTSNADYSWWKDILSSGVLKIADKLIDWYAENSTTPPEIEQTFEVPLPQNINCDDLNVTVDADGNLLICCFTQ